MVETNHFKIDWNKVDKIYRDSVEVKADYKNKVGKEADGGSKTQDVAVTSKKIRRILSQLLDDYAADFKRAATDYSKIVVSLDPIDPKKLSNGWGVHYYEIDEVSPAAGGRKRPFMVYLADGRALDTSIYRQQLTSDSAAAIFEDREAILHAHNLMISRCPSQDSGKTVVGRSRHFLRNPSQSPFENLGKGLRAWAGYERSVRGSCDGLLLQINCAASAFYVDVENYYTLNWLIHGWTAKPKCEDAEEYQDQNRQELENLIKGLRVTATYGKRLPYTVFSLAESSLRNQRRPMADNVRFLKTFPKAKAGKPSSGEQTGKKNIPNTREEDFEERRISVKEHLLSMEPKVELTYPTGLVIIDKLTMIVGADVTHAGVGSQIGSPSIAAVMASRGSDYQQYPALLRCQPNRTERIEHLEEMMMHHLVKFSERNKGNLPEQVISYRDGVSEGEFKMVRTEEHARIAIASAKVYDAREESRPKLLLLCVVKRSNARFYPCSELKGDLERKNGNLAMDSNGNSWPGLVVDSNVTSANYYDFYLQSHKSIQGTAKAAHYVVLLDEIGVTPDTLQKLTYWQCYTFGRSLQAISVHPATRLADRACARGRAYLRKYLVDEGEVSGGTNLTEEEKKEQVYNRTVQDFGKGVNDDLAESMFYI